jgi:hypothetical protein
LVSAFISLVLPIQDANEIVTGLEGSATGPVAVLSLSPLLLEPPHPARVKLIATAPTSRGSSLLDARFFTGQLLYCSRIPAAVPPGLILKVYYHALFAQERPCAFTG